MSSTCGVFWFLTIVAWSAISMSDSFSLFKSCPDGPCDCKHGYISCICNKNGPRENITISNMMNTISSVAVLHCDHVVVEYGAFKFNRLDSLIFHDLNKLEIFQFAFLGNPMIEYINISNVGSLVAHRLPFNNIGNISEIVMSDVQAETLHEFISATNANFVMLEGLKIERMDQSAIHLHDVNNFSFWNSSVNYMHTGAIVISGKADGVYIRNVTFGTVEEEAMIFTKISSHLFLEHCQFETTHPYFLRSPNTKSLGFNHNKIAYCKENSFGFVHVNKEMSFKNNVFDTVHKTCLPLNMSEIGQLMIKDNHFKCDCDFQWFYAVEYLSLFGNGTCSVQVNDTHFTQMRLNEVKPIYKDGDCVSFYDKWPIIDQSPNPMKPKKNVMKSSGFKILSDSILIDFVLVLVLITHMKTTI